jgi:hypothetical protein
MRVGGFQLQIRTSSNPTIIKPAYQNKIFPLLLRKLVENIFFTCLNLRLIIRKRESQHVCLVFLTLLGFLFIHQTVIQMNLRVRRVNTKDLFLFW